MFPLPAIVVRMVGVGDNDLFYFGDARLEAHAGPRQPVTGPVFLVQSMLMCRSDVDAKPKRQTVDLGTELNPGLPTTLFEHKWATINPNGHMAAHVTAVTIVTFKIISLSA